MRPRGRQSHKALDFQIALVLPVQTDGDGVPRDFLQQFFTVCVGRAEKFLAQHDRHFEIDLIGVNTVAWLTDNRLAANAACKVERGQIGIEFLKHQTARGD